MLFTVVGVVLSILGFISGIITGVSLHTFLACVLTWIGSFLYAIIYFGFGMVLENQKVLSRKLQDIENKVGIMPIQESDTTAVKSVSVSTVSKPSNFMKAVNNDDDNSQKDRFNSKKWKCPHCDMMNSMIVTKCVKCGEKRE